MPADAARPCWYRRETLRSRVLPLRERAQPSRDLASGESRNGSCRPWVLRRAAAARPGVTIRKCRHAASKYICKTHSTMLFLLPDAYCHLCFRSIDLEYRNENGMAISPGSKGVMDCMPRPREFDEAAVLDAAVLCFWNRGYEAPSVRELADSMGITGES